MGKGCKAAGDRNALEKLRVNDRVKVRVRWTASRQYGSTKKRARRQGVVMANEQSAGLDAANFTIRMSPRNPFTNKYPPGRICDLSKPEGVTEKQIYIIIGLEIFDRKLQGSWQIRVVGVQNADNRGFPPVEAEIPVIGLSQSS